MKITTKARFLALSNAGRLGNFLRSWPLVVDACVDLGYRGPYTIRNRVPGSPHFVAEVITPADLRRFAEYLLQAGARYEDLYVQEIPQPGTLRRFNIEAMITERGVSMYFERDTTNPVRGIRERGTFAEGLRSQAVLNALLPESREMIEAIWAEFPTAVIEATEFAAPCGAFERELVVWEVRDF